MQAPDILMTLHKDGWRVSYNTDAARAFRDSFFKGRAPEDWPSRVWFKICAERAGLVVDFEAGDRRIV